MSSMRPLLVSAALLALTAPMEGFAPAFAQNAGPDCPAEVAAFLATVRSDDAYPRIQAMFADDEARLDAAMRGRTPDCLVILGEAQRRLVDAGVVVAGATDAAAIERVGRLTGDVPTAALRSVEITPIAPGTDAPDMAVVDVAPTTPVPDMAPDTAPDDVPDTATAPSVILPTIDVPAVGTRPEPETDTAAATDPAATGTPPGSDAATGAIAVLEVEFGFDSAEVPDGARTEVLAEVAGMVGASEGSTVLLTGHASPIGNAAYNLELSERRVGAVAAVLMELGVPDAAISTRAQGEENPEVQAGENETSEENRRVEIRVVAGDAADRG